MPTDRWLKPVVLTTIRNVLRPRWLPLLIGFSISIATFGLWRALLVQERAQIRQLVQLEIAAANYAVTGQFRAYFLALARMAKRWQVRGGTPQAEWEADAQAYLSGYESMEAIAWVDSNSQVNWVVTLADPEFAQNLVRTGLQLYRQSAQESARDLVEVTRQQGEVVVTPIFNLDANNQGVLICTPVFRGGTFDGCIVSVLWTQPLLETLLLGHTLYDQAIVVASGSQVIYSRNAYDRRYESQWGQEANLNLPEVDWRIKVWPTQPLVDQVQSLVSELVLCGGLFVAWVLALAVYLGQKNYHKARRVRLINRELKREISERQRAETLLQNQVERERLVGAIAQRIRQSLDLQAILNTTVHEVRNLLQIERTAIYKVDPGHGGQFIVESVAPGCISVLQTSLEDPCFDLDYSLKYQQGHISAIADIYAADLPQCYIDLLDTVGIRANLLVPIVLGDQLWGLLCAHQSSEPHHWEDSEISLLQQLAVQVAIALQQSQLFEQVQKLNAHLEDQVQDRTGRLQRALDLEAALKRITDKVRDNLDESQILQTVVREMVDALQLSSCGTALYNPEQTTSTIAYGYSTVTNQCDNRVLQMADSPEIYRLLLQGLPLQFCEIIPGTLIGRVVLACPISDEKGVLGDLWLFNHRSYVFDELEIRLAKQVANQCAIAIRQARLYQAAQAQVRELEKLNHLKDDFLSTVSHELRTPISSIMMATQMLEILYQQAGIAKDESSKAARYFQILHDQCHRETSLINDLLDLTRLDADTEPLTLTQVNLQIWLPSIAEPFISRTRNQQQQLQVIVPADLPPLTTDLNCLERIVSELLNNACKYTPPGETITVLAQRIPEKIQIRVSNSGVELPDQELERIFDKFYRIPNHDPWKYGGTGLGLALVKKLVNHLGGTIQAQSLSQQTHLIVQFPLSGRAIAHDSAIRGVL